MKNTTWYQVEPGQIVSFIYKSQTGEKRSAKRTVLCLDPRFSYRKKSTNRLVDYFIGLELDNSIDPQISPPKLKILFELLGKEKDLILDNTGSNQRMEKIYTELKQFLKVTPIFKTYFFRECRKRRVFLEDKYASLNKLQIKQISDRLVEDNKDTIEDVE
jgi:hypothetical protein